MSRTANMAKVAARTRFARSVRCMALLIPLSLVASQARAGSPEERGRAARMACLAGDYVKGVGILAELYVDTKDRTYLFNQGRCFEQNGRYEEAILRFQEFQRKTRDAGAAPDAETERHIADCQALRAKQRQQEAGVVPLPPPAPTVAATTPPHPRPVEVVQAPASNERKGAGLRQAGVVTMVAGGGALIAGLVLNIKANSLASELEAGPDTYRRSKESSRETFQTLGWVGYVGGAALVAGGTIMYIVGQSQASNAKLALLPSLGPGTAGAILQGAF